MNLAAPVPFYRHNSYICQYLETCVINQDPDETKWLLIAHAFNAYKKQTGIQIKRDEVERLFERILEKLNNTRPNISDFIDLTDPSQIQSMNDFIQSLNRFSILKLRVDKTDDEKKFIEFMQLLLPIATGKIFTPQIISKYINLLSKQNTEIIPLNFTMSFICERGPSLPTYSVNLLSTSLINDVFEPIEKFVTSVDPATKIFIPVLREYGQPQKNYWLLMVLHKEQVKLNSGQVKEFYISSLYSPYEIEFKVNKLRTLKYFLKDTLLKKLKNFLLQSDTPQKVQIIDDFINQWIMQVVPTFHQPLARINVQSKSKYDMFGPYSGVAVIEYMRHIVYNIEMNFSEENIAYFRERIIKELYDNQIIAPLKQPYDHNTNKYKLFQEEINLYDDYYTFEEHVRNIDHVIGLQKRPGGARRNLVNLMLQPQLIPVNIPQPGTSTGSAIDPIMLPPLTPKSRDLMDPEKFLFLSPNSPPKSTPKQSKTLIQTPSISTPCTSSSCNTSSATNTDDDKNKRKSISDDDSSDDQSTLFIHKKPLINLNKDTVTQLPPGKTSTTKQPSSSTKNSITSKTDTFKNVSILDFEQALPDELLELDDDMVKNTVTSTQKQNDILDIENQLPDELLYLDNQQPTTSKNAGNMFKRKKTDNTKASSSLAKASTSSTDSNKTNITPKRRVKSIPKKVISLNEVQPQVLSETELDELLSQIDKEAKINPQTMNNPSTSTKHTQESPSKKKNSKESVKGKDSSSKKGKNDDFGEISECDESLSQDLMASNIKTPTSTPKQTTSTLLTPIIHNLHVESPTSSNKKQKYDDNNNKSDFDSQSSQKSSKLPLLPYKAPFKSSKKKRDTSSSDDE